MRLDPPGDQRPSGQLHDRPDEVGDLWRHSGRRGDRAAGRGEAARGETMIRSRPTPRTTLAILCGWLITSPALGQAPELTGNWNGYWTRAGDTLPINMVVRRDSAGRYSAAFDSERL